MAAPTRANGSANSSAAAGNGDAMEIPALPAYAGAPPPYPAAGRVGLTASASRIAANVNVTAAE